MNKEREQYKCQSYYDDNNILQDCTCGKCGSKEEWEMNKIKNLSDNELKWKLFGQCFQSDWTLYKKLNDEKGKRIKDGKWTLKN